MRPRYRASGADAPWHDPRRAHGVAMEGYFWRFTDAAGGRVVAALCGVSRAADGPWAAVALAAHPGGATVTRVLDRATADPARLGVDAGPGVMVADERTVRLDLGPEGRLEVEVADPVPWPLRLGGVGLGHVVPGLGQYWHPWLLGGTVRGFAEVGGERVPLDGATVYAEKNWGSGFPQRWWWGQAQGFDRPDAGIAFAGGPVRVGPVGLDATALVVRLGDRVLRLGDPLRSPVRADVGDGSWRLLGRAPGLRVEIEGEGRPADGHLLPVPEPEHRTVFCGALEHLGARMVVTVRRRGRLLWRGESRLAGLEIGGPAALAEARRRASKRGQVVGVRG